MKLFVGLGNPGKNYKLNRHNIGFEAIDTIFLKYANSGWSSKFSAEISICQINGKKLILAKPQTYMNLSGQSVVKVANFFKIPSFQITVFHDDLDIEIGRIKIKVDGGHGGHNGLRSLDQYIGSNYKRVRIGIGHPGHKDQVSGYVLSNFNSSEKTVLNNLIDSCASAAELLYDDSSNYINCVYSKISTI